MLLSKSQYVRGLQCYKSLWLYKNRKDLRKAPENKRATLFQIGSDVGELARELFPNGTEIEFNANDFSGMIKKTKQLIEKDTETIYEATFNENDIFVMVDILVRNGNGWNIYEVKSTTKIKEYHIDDISIQWYALKDRFNLEKAYIIHINNKYLRKGELKIRALFHMEDVTQQVQDKLEEIPLKLKEMQDILKQSNEPNIDIGPHCFDPFECEFYEYCWRDIPKKHSIFELINARKKKWELYKEDILYIIDIPDDKLTESQKIQKNTLKSSIPHIDKKIIKEFIDKVSYPISFLDFETFMEVIPRFDNQKPYQQIPFQYSLHILYQNGDLDHKEFLADENSDPRPEFIKKLLKDIPKDGTIVAYNISFEVSRIKELAEFDTSNKNELLALTK